MAEHPKTEVSVPTAGEGGQYRCGFVALLGRPNVGKSTLLNTLVGSPIAIVSPKPQTTRTRLVGIKTLDHAQLLFIDTPGLHTKTPSLLNQRMVDVAFSAVSETDVVLFVLDAERGVVPADHAIAQRLAQAGVSVITVLNKIDRVSKSALVPLLERATTLLPQSEVIPVSALTGENLQELMRNVIALLPEGPALYPSDELTDQSERVLAQEMIREQVFRQTKQEVPYATGVLVEEFQEKPEKRVLVISAVIFVERPSQRAILIGRRGARLKEIGRAARQRLEVFFDCKVFLELFVKVAKGWTNSPLRLRDMGL
ncbi:MAG: GTPase Era [Candidatus Binatia bacterium]